MSEEADYREYVRRQVESMAEGLTRVLFGDYDVVLEPTEADQDFGRLAMMTNVAINSARNAIQDREDLLRKVEDQKGRLAVILETTDEGILYLRKDRLLYANGSFSSMTGIGEEEVVGLDREELLKRLLQLAPSPIHVLERGLLGDAEMQAGQDTRCVFERPLRRVLRVLYHPVVGQDGGRLILLRDITQVDEARRAHDELLGNLAHEIKTPLTTIKGYVELLARGRLGEVDARQSEVLGTIGKSVDRLTGLVENMLDADRRRSAIAKRTPSSLRDALREVLHIESQRAARKGLTVETYLGGDTAEVLCEYPVLVQIARNLISNAIKYTPEGVVQVRILDEQDGTVGFEVEDEGIGMPEHECARVFDRFYRVEDPLVLSVGGTGVGLSIVKAYLEAVDGSVEVTSEPGRGSLFRVRIPSAAA